MREPVEEKGKQGLCSLPLWPTAPPAVYALPPYSGNYPTRVVIDGIMEEYGTVVRLNSGTIDCDYELAKQARPLNKTSPMTFNSGSKKAISRMATEGSLKGALLEEES